jgi:hypothetical protein
MQLQQKDYGNRLNFVAAAKLAPSGASGSMEDLISEDGFLSSTEWGIHFKRWRFRIFQGWAFRPEMEADRWCLVQRGSQILRMAAVLSAAQEGYYHLNWDKIASRPPFGTPFEQVSFAAMVVAQKIELVVLELDGFHSMGAEYRTEYHSSSDVACFLSVPLSGIGFAAFFSPTSERSVALRRALSRTAFGTLAAKTVDALSHEIFSEAQLVPLADIMT